jgi:hypothetical protein
MFRRIIEALLKLIHRTKKVPTSDLSYYSGANLDQVIYSTIISTTVPNSVGVTNYVIGTPLFGYNWPVGIYSYDGGTTYNDFVPTTLPGGSLLTNATSTTAPKVYITPPVDSSGNCTLRIDVKATVGGGSTIPIDARVALLAISDPTGLTVGVPTTQSSVGNKLAYTSSHEGLGVQYRQILLDSNSPLSTSTLNIYTVPHSVGAIPNPQVWFFDGTKNTIMSNYWDVRYKPLNANNGGVAGVAMDASNFYFSPLTALASSETHYRIYKEN